MHGLVGIASYFSTGGLVWSVKHFLYIAGRDDLIATNTRLLSIKYEFYGFSGDLIETIN